MATIKHVCFSFDVDLTDYGNESTANEMETAFPFIRSVLERYPQVKTTWFIRIDQHIEAIYGDAKYVFKKFPEEIDWLRQNGHEIGWHHHAYSLNDDKQWIPEKNEWKVIDQLAVYAPEARAEGLTVSRMGWGYQTNNILSLLENHGFKADSSAIPRPVYPWDNGLKNWEGAGQTPYYPAKDDYRKEGSPRKIMQVPMSTVPLSLPGDTKPGIRRYINLAYKKKYFEAAINTVDNEVLVTITHPYEIVATGQTNESISFSENMFLENLEATVESGQSQFITIIQLSELYR